MRSFYQFLHGIFGEVSVLTLAFLIHCIGKRLLKRDLLSVSDRSLLLYGVAAVGIILYPTALGLSRWDLYRLGYQPVFLLLLLSIGVLWGWFSGCRRASMLLLIAVITHNIGLMESDNLWDYLIDPFVTIYAFVWSQKKGLRAMRRTKGDPAYERGSSSNLGSPAPL